jgi:hypothetical protein
MVFVKKWISPYFEIEQKKLVSLNFLQSGGNELVVIHFECSEHSKCIASYDKNRF